MGEGAKTYTPNQYDGEFVLTFFVHDIIVGIHGDSIYLYNTVKAKCLDVMQILYVGSCFFYI